MTPARLDHAGIEALIPHRGPMCLLDRMTSWDETRIECVAVNHRDPRHPLRSASGLLASAAIEYAAQAMAVHGALLRRRRGRPRRARLPGQRARRPPRLHGASTTCRAPIATSWSSSPNARPPTRRACSTRSSLRHDGRELASGRVAVVLDAGLAHAR